MTEDEIRGTTMAVSGLNMIEDKTIEMEGITIVVNTRSVIPRREEKPKDCYTHG